MFVMIVLAVALSLSLSLFLFSAYLSMAFIVAVLLLVLVHFVLFGASEAHGSGVVCIVELTCCWVGDHSLLLVSSPSCQEPSFSFHPHSHCLPRTCQSQTLKSGERHKFSRPIRNDFRHEAGGVGGEKGRVDQTCADA